MMPIDSDRPPNLGKLLEDAADVAGEGGLYGKYLVYPREAQGQEGDYSNLTDVFVLRPANDPAAKAALAAYAEATDNAPLASDLWRWLALLGMTP